MNRRNGRKSPFRRFQRRNLLIPVAVLALLILRGWHPEWYQSPGRPPPPVTLEEGTYRVERVVDGDTLLLANQGRIRLIGADTPETVMPNHPIEPWGPEATEFTEHFVAGGEVRLQFDGRRQDKYGRFLAHIWVGDRMLEEELLRAGLATAETDYSYSAEAKDRFRAAETEARTARRGIWSE